MVNPGPAAWRVLFQTYPCPTCGADVGEECTTRGGNPAWVAHAARARHGARCPVCATLLPAEADPASLCDRCALVRSLEVERATRHHRRG
jgi:hypothetical protein